MDRPLLHVPGLPDLEVRPARLDDVDAVYGLVAGAALAVTGDPDTTREEMLSEMQDPRLDLASDTTLVLTDPEKPQALAYALAYDEHEAEVYIDVYLEPSLRDEQFVALGEPLVAWALDRIRQRLRATGRASAKVGTGSYRGEQRQRGLLEDAGFVAERTFWRMRVELADRPPRPPLPDSVSLRRLDLHDEGDRRLAHRLHEEPFTDHYGYQPESFEMFWASNRADDPVHDPSMWWLAEVDGEPAGLLIGDETRAAEGGGFVPSLGVLVEHRGRGIGRQLLHEAFDQYAARGRDWVALGVDSENTTGATGLYESVGMSSTATIVAYARQVTAEPG